MIYFPNKIFFIGRMAKRGTRSGKKSRIASRIFAPVGFVLNATGKVAKGVANTTGELVHKGFHGVRKIGNSVAKGANNMINRATRRRRRN